MYHFLALDDETHIINGYRRVFRQLFDGESAHVVLLNLQGIILQTNRAWDQFGIENGLPAAYTCVGQDYLRILESAAEQNYPWSQEAYIGILAVLHFQRPKFTMVYPCHSPLERRWYRMWVEPQMPEVPVVVVAHHIWLTKPISEIATEPDVWLGVQACDLPPVKHPFGDPRDKTEND